MENKTTKCRGCGKVMSGDGTPGNSVIANLNTMELAKWNHYGGYVCSKECDFKSSLELERSMPGHGGYQKSIGQAAQRSLKNNWDN